MLNTFFLEPERLQIALTFHNLINKVVVAGLVRSSNFSKFEHYYHYSDTLSFTILTFDILITFPKGATYEL